METATAGSIAELGAELKMQALVNRLPASGHPSIDAQRFIPFPSIGNSTRVHVALAICPEVTEWGGEPAWMLGLAWMRAGTTLSPDEWTPTMRKLADELYARLMGDVGLRGIDNEGTVEQPLGLCYLRRLNDIDKAFAGMSHGQV